MSFFLKSSLATGRVRYPQAALKLSLLALGLASLAVPAAQADAATLTVTNTADDGSAGTLRSQIAAANPGDTIDIAVTGTINLIQGALSINNSLNINGPGASSLTVNAGGKSQVFVIGNSQSTVALSGLTAQDGYYFNDGSSNSFGGGISNSAKLTLLNCVVTSNTAESDFGGVNSYGGGIYSNGPLTLTNCTISGNNCYADAGAPNSVSSAAYGGGIYCDEALVMNNCTVSGNSLTGGAESGQSTAGEARGGGIWVDGTALITSTLVSGNSATGGAGRAAVSEEDSYVSDAGPGAGAGIDSSGSLTLTGCTISGNTATGGYVSGNQTGVFPGYAGSGYGGGVNADNDSSMTLNVCMITGNSAVAGSDTSGSGDNGSSYGGGLDGEGGASSLTNCALVDNSAQTGGAVEDSSPKLVNCTVTANSATTAGGVDATSSSCTVLNGILWNNTDSTSSKSSGSTENLRVTSGSKVSVIYSDVPTGNSSSAAYPGERNIAADPLFARAPSSGDYGDLHLQSNSPALGAGKHSGAPATTIDGVTRPNPPSMGAYEALSVATLVSVSLSPTAVYGGSTDSTGTVTLSSAAPSGGAVVTLASSNTFGATVPDSVTVPAGATTATFAVTSKVVTSPTAVRITAIYAGVSQITRLDVNPTHLKSLVLNPAMVNGGTAATTAGRVYWTNSAPANEVVELTSSNPAVASVPSHVTIAPEFSSHSFSITTKPVKSAQKVTITATSGGVTLKETLTVTP